MKEISFKNDVLPLKNELFRLALRITLNHADAEDVVQETMMKVWSRRDSWAEIEQLDTYCLTICRNLSLDKLRKASRQELSIDETMRDTADQSHNADPEAQAISANRIELVRRLIARLPEKQRSCIQLRDIEGKSYRDIATILGISEEQVKVNIFRARQTVRQKFDENDKYGL